MFAITGGGTGGHLAIAKALAESIRARGEEAIYIGSCMGQDKAWFEGSELFTQSYFLDSTGVVNKRGLARLGALFKQLKGALHARKILKNHQVRCVISVGGFSAGGASMGALIARIPLFIHEQNAIKGKLNEILTPFARAVFGSFTPKDSRHFIHTSYPVRDEFFAHARTRKEVKKLLFLGGSQGAKGINDFALSLTPLLLERGISVAHQCGERDFERVSAAYRAAGLSERVELFAFDKNLVARLSEADLCVARSGASSLWEMSANGLLGVYVPYPHAAKDHQYFNAKSFSDEGLGLTLREGELDSQSVLKFIESMNAKDSKGISALESLSHQMRQKIKPQGAEEILQHIHALLHR